MIYDDSPGDDYQLRPAPDQPGTLHDQWRLAHTPRRFDRETLRADGLLVALSLAGRHRRAELVKALESLLAWKGARR